MQFLKEKDWSPVAIGNEAFAKTDSKRTVMWSENDQLETHLLLSMIVERSSNMDGLHDESKFDDGR